MSSVAAAALRIVMATIACSALLAGCAAVQPRLVSPEVRTVDVRVVVFDFPRVRMVVDLGLHNPNTRPIAIESLDLEVFVEGEPVARTSLAAPVALAAGTTTALTLDTSGHLGAALAGVARSLDRGGRALAYRIAGRARLADGSEFPLRRAGVLAYRQAPVARP